MGRHAPCQILQKNLSNVCIHFGGGKWINYSDFEKALSFELAKMAPDYINSLKLSDHETGKPLTLTPSTQVKTVDELYRGSYLALMLKFFA
jgi:hypothetical protein